MTLKRTQLARLQAARLETSLRKARPPERYGSGSALVSRKEQRRIDKARGLVPFATKLHGDLVKKLQARAEEQGRPLNEVVAELLEKSL